MSNGDRAHLLVQLRERLPALQMALARANNSVAGGDPMYAQAAQAAATACLECWLFALERGEQWSGPAPPAVGLQARRAACGGTSLAELMRCYMRARDLVWRMTLDEIEHTAISSETMLLLRQAWAVTESLSSALSIAIEDAHDAEVARQAQTPVQRQAELVYRLLAGDRSVDLRTVPYDFAARHLGLIAVGGRSARRALETLAERVGCRLYCLPEQDNVLEAWLALRAGVDVHAIERGLPAHRGLMLAIGRVGDGLDGFLRTHRQASEALTVARRRQRHVVWYRDVELDALLLRHQALAESLIATYLTPLDRTLQKTLRTYYNSGDRNATVTAKALKVDRRTIPARLLRAEASIGQPLDNCRIQIELALRAADLGIPSATY